MEERFYQYLLILLLLPFEDASDPFKPLSSSAGYDFGISRSRELI